MMIPRPDKVRSEAGAVAITTAILLMALVMMAAIIVDIGILRVDHRDNQTVADMAVAAGGMALGANVDRVTACNDAWDYLVNNLAEVPNDEPQPSPDCEDVFSGDCDPVPPADPALRDQMVASLAGGSIQVVIRMPVFDTDAVMQPSRQAIEPDRDGSPCERISVEVRQNREHRLAVVQGFTEGSSISGAVARRMQVGDAKLFASLVVLDRVNCQTIRANSGEMEVLSYTDPVTGEHPGTIAVDAAPSSCGKNNEVIDLEGATSTVHAEGDIFSYGLGEGGTPEESVYNNGQVENGRLRPRPQAGPIIRRDAIDHRYNCETTAGRYDQAGDEAFRPNSNWVTEADVDHSGMLPCEDVGKPSYIRHLYEYIASRIEDREDVNGDGFIDDAENAPDGVSPEDEFDADGFEVYTGPCNNITLTATDTQRNWYFPCNNASIDSVIIPEADMVVFAGGVDVGTTLRINQDAAGNTGSSDATVVVWDGDVATNNGEIIGDHVFWYTDKGMIDKGGGGTIFLEAPEDAACDTSGLYPSPECFEDLVSWSNGFGPNPQDFYNLKGNGCVEVIGTVFVPNGVVDVAGGACSDLEDAQFFGWRFEYSGAATLTLRPNPDRATPIKLFGAGLIR